MGTRAANRFSDVVLGNAKARSHAGTATRFAATSNVGLGHPIASDLEIGQTVSCEMASVFLDLTNFTGRTFWDDPFEVTMLAHNVLCGFSTVVSDLGGHVLGLRGDGLFAGFGPTNDPSVSVAVAALACATALDAVKNDLNPRLQSNGIAPVQARAGADYGETYFVRSGVPASSEVNVIGFAPNFAAKCEKAALSWELVVGERFGSYIYDASLLEKHPDSPKRYSRNYQDKAYGFSKYRWAGILRWVDSTIDEIQGRPLEELVG